jgi:hypothetical protein
VRECASAAGGPTRGGPVRSSSKASGAAPLLASDRGMRGWAYGLSPKLTILIQDPKYLLLFHIAQDNPQGFGLDLPWRG